MNYKWILIANQVQLLYFIFTPLLFVLTVGIKNEMCILTKHEVLYVFYCFLQIFELADALRKENEIYRLNTSLTFHDYGHNQLIEGEHDDDIVRDECSCSQGIV